MPFFILRKPKLNMGIISYTIAFILLIYCFTALVQKRTRSFNSAGTPYYYS